MNSSCHIIRASVLFDFHQMGLTETATRDNDRKKEASCCAPHLLLLSFSLHPIPSPLSSASLYQSLPPNLRRKFGFFPAANKPLAHTEESSAGGTITKCCCHILWPPSLLIHTSDMEADNHNLLAMIALMEIFYHMQAHIESHVHCLIWVRSMKTR